MCFLQVGAQVSLKVASEGSFGGKKNSEKLRFLDCFPKQKRKSATKKFEIFLIILASLYIVQLYIFWNSVHALKVAIKGCIRCKKALKV